MSYWDTGCLVKLYTPEPNSVQFSSYLAANSTCVTADLAPLEFWATVRRKEAEGLLSAGGAQKVQTAFESDIDAGLIQVQASDESVRRNTTMSWIAVWPPPRRSTFGRMMPCIWLLPKWLARLKS